MLERRKISADLCVVGGGMAGFATAIAAAREGIKVALIHERPVLGGNASSEIRMWICGAQGANNRETGILEELLLENLYKNPTKNYYLWDALLYDFVNHINAQCGLNIHVRCNGFDLLFARRCANKGGFGNQITVGVNIKIVVINDRIIAKACDISNVLCAIVDLLLRIITRR